VLGGLLLLVALVSSCALVVLTIVLRHETTWMDIADQRIRASLQTKVALLWYARASDAAVSHASPMAAVQKATAEAELRAALAETRRLATPQRIQQLDNLVAKAAGYIELRDRLEAERLPLGVVLDRSTPSLEAVFVDLQQLISADDSWVRSVQAEARRSGSFANVAGLSAAVLLVLGFAAAIIGTHLLAERPVLALTNTMGRFARGDERSRSVPRGARELREMALTFNAMADRLVRQSKDRLAFLSGVAHDLRNPLSALRFAIESARHGPQPPPAEKTSRTLEIAGRQVDRLDRMVGDLLDATRIEAGHLELRPEIADLRALVVHVGELFGPAAATHQILVQTPEAPMILACDPTRIEQVLDNLVSNAVKYSPRGGRVTVAAFEEGTDAVVAVSDQGIGIPQDELERIFEPFRRTRDSQALIPGVGIGLSVARKIVEAHGGHIEVESEVGGGSTFRVRLPRQLPFTEGNSTQKMQPVGPRFTPPETP
jgi:two-component system, OmpR family, sensor histidine kinase MtrB